MKKQEPNSYHITVLLNEAVEHLKIKNNHWYVDATLGGGGHSQAILQSGGNLLALDQDQDAIDEATPKLQQAQGDQQFKIVKTNFRNMSEAVKEAGITPSGVLFDLGVSSHQIDGNQRGFSFQQDEPLDMRMDPDTQKTTARDLVNDLDERELKKIITLYGEDRLAASIANSIESARRTQPIETTKQLADIVAYVYKQTYSGRSKKHPATKTFQALRIAVNDEMNTLKSALKQAIEILEPEGRCVVITFHGLEDSIVKRQFRRAQAQGQGKVLNKKPILPNQEEQRVNPRSRSAKLRVFEKTN